MPNYDVLVKFGKESFPNITLSTDEEPMVFKAQVYALTGVLPERQKLFFKGAVLKDDSNWNTLKLNNGMTILLMGSKEPLPLEPAAQTVFVEDMDDTQLAVTYKLPAGLKNMGNTCYLNATLQCLRTVPELCEALRLYNNRNQIPPDSLNMIDLSGIATAAMKDLFNNMSKPGVSFYPVSLLRAVHLALPGFAQQVEEGLYMQQDANECWMELVRLLQIKLHGITPEGTINNDKKFVDQFFVGNFEEEMKCIEVENEPPTKTVENFVQLNCFISQDVKYMMNGIKSKMQEVIVKHSPTLGRDASYSKTSKISRLPAYLAVQFVRFFFKERESINAKILKEIKFPMEFDAFDLCSPELQERMTPMRHKFKEFEDKLTGIAIDVGASSKKPDGKDSKKEPYWFPDDYGSNNSGYYTLKAVLTHRGRSSSSGHYVAWIKQDQRWLKCDDEQVSVVPSEDILKLSGGGDWHCGYVLLYGPRILEVLPED